MKIDQDAAAQRSAQKSEDAEDLKKAKTAQPRSDDFKTLLARKSGAPPQGSARGAFGAKLQDGRVQVGEQAAVTSRTRAERALGQGRQEVRVEQRHIAGDASRVGSAAQQGEGAQKSRQIGEALDAQAHQKMEHKSVARDSDHKIAARELPATSRELGGVNSQRATLAPRASVAEGAATENPAAATSAEVGGVAQPAARAEAAKTPTSSTAERHAEVAKIARELVEKAHLGTDTSGRQIMMMELEVPGRGQIRVRLRRRGDGFELRMRPQNQELARDLRQERHHFREAAAGRGVTFSSIEIV